MTADSRRLTEGDATLWIHLDRRLALKIALWLAACTTLICVGVTGLRYVRWDNRRQAEWLPSVDPAAPLVAFPISFEGPYGGRCPTDWICHGQSRVCKNPPITKFCIHPGVSGLDGSQYMTVGNDLEMGNATSPTFFLPELVDRIDFMRSGGADAGSGFFVHLARNHEAICNVEGGLDTNKFFRQSCNIAGYVGEAVYIALRDIQSSPWGKVLVDDIRLKSSTGRDIVAVVQMSTTSTTTTATSTTSSGTRSTTVTSITKTLTTTTRTDTVTETSSTTRTATSTATTTTKTTTKTKTKTKTTTRSRTTTRTTTTTASKTRTLNFTAVTTTTTTANSTISTHTDNATFSWILPPHSFADERTSLIIYAGKDKQPYIDGAIMLGLVLKQVVSQFPRLCVVVRSMSAENKRLLVRASWSLIEVDDWHPSKQHFAHNYWWDVYNKINVFRVKTRHLMLYLDADMYVFSDQIREILERQLPEGKIGMVKDEQNNNYNTGLMLFWPDLDMFHRLHSDMVESSGWGGLDQPIINREYDGRIVQLETQFNAHGSSSVCDRAVVAHYTGQHKPSLANIHNLRMVKSGYHQAPPYLQCPNLYSSYFCAMKHNAEHLTTALQAALHKVDAPWCGPTPSGQLDEPYL